MPDPCGGQWAATTINGNRDRGTGILNNELYVGRLVWNRLRYIKDPDTGKRRSRLYDTAAVISKDVPELRLIEDALWAAVLTRQGHLGQRHGLDGSQHGSEPFWSKQRPKHLFSGLMRCGVRGGRYSKIGARHFGCPTTNNKGPTACTDRQDHLESRVLDGLRERMMDPALCEQFACAFTAEWNRKQSKLSDETMARNAELTRIIAQLEKLVDAFCNGTLATSGRIDRSARGSERDGNPRGRARFGGGITCYAAEERTAREAPR